MGRALDQSRAGPCRGSRLTSRTFAPVRTALALAVALLLHAKVAIADRPHLKDPIADQHLQRGLDHFEAKNYAAASKAMELANAIEPTPFLVYSQAQSERLGGHCARAVELYKEFLRAPSIALDSQDAARGFVKQCEESMPTPPSGPEPVTTPPQVAGPWYTSRLGNALTISGAVGSLLGIAFLSMSSGTKDRAEQEMFLDDYEAGLRDASRERTIGGLALGLGLGLIGGGVYAYVTRHSRKPSTTVTTDGRSVLVEATF